MNSIIEALKERGWNSVRGSIFLLGGICVAFISLYHVQYILHAFGAFAGLLCVSEGAYLIWHNPIVKAINQEALKIARLTGSESNATSSGTTNP